MDPTIWSLKGWCHSSECDLDFYPSLPLYISAEPLTGTIAHPWTVIPVLSSYCLDPSWDPAGTLEFVQGTNSAEDLPQTLRGTQSACTNLIQSTLVPLRKKKKEKTNRLSFNLVSSLDKRKVFQTSSISAELMKSRLWNFMMKAKDFIPGTKVRWE